MSLTDRSIAALPIPATGQQFHSDRSIAGFGVRVSQGGAKTFVLVVGAERRKITIGRYPIIALSQAREKARTILAQRQLGLDKPLSPYFGEVEEKYRAFREETLRAGTLRKDPRLFKIFAPLTRTRIAEIEPRDVQVLLGRLSAISTRQGAHNRIVGLIRFALKRGHLETWPLHRQLCT